VLIQAWQKYYNPKFCPDYWDILIEFGKQDKIFIPVIDKFKTDSYEIPSILGDSKFVVKFGNLSILLQRTNIRWYERNKRVLSC